MRNDEIVSNLRELAMSCNESASFRVNKHLRRQLRKHAEIVLAAADAIVQLQQRLVKQACYFEYIEAANEPKSWPLLRDDEEGL